MWWYYKCVNLIKVLIQGSKSYYFLHWKCLAKTSRAGGAPPRTDALIGPAALWGMSKPDSWKDDARVTRTLFSSSGALTLLNMAWTSLKLRFPFSRLRPTTRAGPLDPRLGNQPFMGLRLCQSRNGATNSTIAEGSFPGDVTQPSQISTREQPKEPELNTWRPKQRTHAGRKRNQRIEPALKPIQASTNWIPNPDWTG